MSGGQVESFDGSFEKIKPRTSLCNIKIAGKFSDNLFTRRKQRKILIRTMCKKLLC